MPMLWGRSPDGTTHEGGWRNDPARQFDRRFHNGKAFTPYVLVGNETIWDLAFARRTPLEHEYDRVPDMVLIDSRSRITLRRHTVEISCMDNEMALMWARITLKTLTRFELCQPGNPDTLVLSVAARNLPRYPQDHIGQGRAGVLSMSMMFGPEHESALRDLRDFLERLCDRSLTEPDEMPAARAAGRPHAPERAEECATPRAALSDERVDYWEPATEPERIHDEPAGDGPGFAVRQRRSGGAGRPAPRALAVSAESAPDTEEWLSFAAPSIEVLTTSGDAAQEGAGGPDKHADVHDREDQGDSHA